jgi:hypothetical protein
MRYVSTPLLWALLQSTCAGLTATVSTASAHKSAAPSQLYLARQLSQVKLSRLFIFQDNASFSVYYNQFSDFLTLPSPQALCVQAVVPVHT